MAALAASAIVDLSVAQEPFKLVRSEEDYAAMRTQPEAPDASLKFIALDDSRSMWLTLGGEVRERTEFFDAARFGFGFRRDTYDLQRLLVHADLHLGASFRVFAQLGQHSAYGKRPPLALSDTNPADIQNFFVDATHGIGSADDAVRVGRQEIQLNPMQRVVSVREGPNVRQSFDGGRAWWKGRDLRVDAFVVRPVRFRPGTFNDHGDSSQVFRGVYLSHATAGGSVDAFAYDLRREDVSFGTVVGDERRTSVGARWGDKRAPLDIDIESMTQFGRFAGRSIRAWAVGADAGYTFASAWSPRVGLGFDAGSGDRDPDDGRLETFNPLFPRGGYFNDTALTSWSNLVLARFNLGLKPSDQLSLQASVMRRWRQTTTDAVYVQPSIALSPTLSNGSRHVGEIYQIGAVWRLDRHLTLSGQLLRLQAGPAITRSGGKNVNFATVITQYRF